MKNIVYPVIVLFALLSCAKDEDAVVKKPISGDPTIATAVTLNIIGFENEDGTKASINSELNFSWSKGDVFGVWPLTVDSKQKGTQVDFTVDGPTGATATTVGKGWGLICNGKYKYASYFPFDSGCSQDSIVVTYPTYIQMLAKDQMTQVNGNLYMYAPAIAPEHVSSANFSFYQLGAIAKFVITPDKSAKYRKITISASDTVFRTSASYSLVEEGINGTTKKPTITGTPTESYIGVNLYDLPISESAPLTLCIPMCPAELEGVKFSIKLYDDADHLYYGEKECKKNQESGIAYRYEVSVKLQPDVHPVPPEGVDLGDGLLYAPYNLGAKSPEENGLRFAYAETESKATFTKENYSRYDKDGSFITPTYKTIAYLRDGATDSIRVQVLADSLDAAAQMWQDGWFIPEYSKTNQWLQEYCDKEWTTYNGIPGYRFYNRKDHSKSIFIASGSDLVWFQNEGNVLTSYLWSAFYDSNKSFARAFHIQKQRPQNMGVIRPPYEGYPVRPVKLKK